MLRRRWGLVAAMTFGILGCSTSPQEAKQTAPGSRELLQEEVLAARDSQREQTSRLDRTAKGYAMLAKDPNGSGLALAYDARRDDPVARWGSCVDLATRCYRDPSRRTVDECASTLPPCTSNRGGEACCPPACINAYVEARRRGRTAAQAIQDSYLDGLCVEGFPKDKGKSP